MAAGADDAADAVLDSEADAAGSAGAAPAGVLLIAAIAACSASSPAAPSMEISVALCEQPGVWQHYSNIAGEKLVRNQTACDWFPPAFRGFSRFCATVLESLGPWAMAHGTCIASAASLWWLCAKLLPIRTVCAARWASYHRCRAPISAFRVELTLARCDPPCDLCLPSAA